MAKHYVYDIEVAKNFFCAVFLDIDTPQELIDEYIDADIDGDIERKAEALERINPKIFVIYNNRNDIRELKRFVNASNESMFIGYNSLAYDNIIIDYIFTTDLSTQDTATITESIYKLSSNIISFDGYNFRKVYKIKYSKRYVAVDLYTLNYLDANRISLKQVEIALKWYKVKEYVMPKPEFWEIQAFYDGNSIYANGLNTWDRYVVNDYDVDLIDYCVNDVLATNHLLNYSRVELKQRFKAMEIYGAGSPSDSRSTLADKLMGKAYTGITGMTFWEYYRGRTYRSMIPMNNIIQPSVEFTSPELKTFLKEVRDYTIFIDEEGNSPKFEKIVDFKGKKYMIAKGGIHSVDNPQVFTAKNDKRLIDVDATSYYPIGILNMQVVPKHVSPSMLEILERFTYDRIEAKASGNKDEAGILKIVVNSVYGKLGSNKSWLYDLQAMYTVTVNLQLFLLMLIEGLEIAGFEVISANTDGVLCIVPDDRYEDYKMVCEAWAKQLKFGVEYTEYDLYARTTVNDYMATVTGSDEIKLKGDFVFKKGVEKGYFAPIIAKTLVAYYTKGVNIREYLYSQNKPTDIYDFCISVKVGSQFETVHYKIVDGKPVETVLQRNNRYYVSRRSGILRKKHKSTGKYTNILSGYNTVVFNDFYKVEHFIDYDINYRWYEARVMDFINRMNRESHKKKTIVENTGRLFDEL